jgi:hypothetical protein
MKKYLFGIFTVALVLVGSLFFTTQQLSAASTCRQISIGWRSTQLPPNTKPSFVVNGPDGLVLNPSDFTSGAGGFTLDTAPSGGLLPSGRYTFIGDPMVGTSQLKSINGVNGTTLGYGCENASMSFHLEYGVVPGSGSGPSLRVTPTTPQTIKVGEYVYYGAEYKPNGSNSWQDVSAFTGISSPQEINTNPNGIIMNQGRSHGTVTTEFHARAVGTAEIIATYGGLTSNATLTVLPGGATAPPSGGTCSGLVMKSNVPTTWTITGPNGVSVKNPAGTGASTGFTVTKSASGGALPSGNYTIQVEVNPSGGQNPTLQGLGPMNGGMGTYECVRGTWAHVTVTYGGGSNGNILTFQKTLLNMGTEVGGGAQGIVDGAFINNHFVFMGSGCSVNMNNQVAGMQSGGSGLWSISEDGSRIQERQRCLDGGAVSNKIYHHGINDGRMYADSSSGFVFTNSTWAAGISGCNGGWCAVNGDGATKTVYYTFEGDQVEIRSVSSDAEEGGLITGGGKISNGYGFDLQVTKLIDWNRIGSSPVWPVATFSGYVLGYPSPVSGPVTGKPVKVYKNENGRTTLVGDLPGDVRGMFGANYTFDFSKSPAQLVINQGTRLIWYRAGTSGLELVKEMKLSGDFTGSQSGLNKFAVWGDYIIWPFAGEHFSGGVIVGKASGTTYSKVESVILPDAGSPQTIIASPAGNVVITTLRALSSTDYALKTQAHLYKIGSGSIVPVGGTPIGGTGFNGLPPGTTEKELTTVTKSILQQMGIGNCPLPPTGATINTTGPAQLGAFLNCLLQTSLSGPYTSPPISSNTPTPLQRHPISALTPATPTQSSNNVSLTKTLLTQPGNGYFTNNEVPLVGARWIEGKFVVSSFCSGGNNSKGLWIFNESGTQTGARDVCKDAGEDTNGSTDHTWSVSPNVQPVGNGQFVKEMSPNNNRPPLLYKVSSGALVSKAWDARGASENGSDVTDNIAGIPGYAVVVENGTDNVLYGLPDWNVLQRVSKKFQPITGVGNYIVGTPTPGNRDLVLYKVTNNALQLVNKVDTSIRPVAAAVDPSSNGTRVGFLFINDGGTGKNHADIYTVGSTGLKFVKKVTLPSTTSVTSSGWQGAFAINGDYVAFSDCGLPALATPSGTGDNTSAAKCGLAVLKGTTRMTVQRIPNATANDGTEILPPAIRGIAFSPNGMILVTNYYGAYLYRIGGSVVGN